MKTLGVLHNWKRDELCNGWYNVVFTYFVLPLGEAVQQHTVNCHRQTLNFDPMLSNYWPAVLTKC